MIRELRIRNYSPRTIKTYVSLLSKLAQFHNTSPEVLTSEQIKQYLHQRVEKDNISVSTINQTIGALKILHQDVLGRDWEQIKVKRPRKEKRLPIIFSKQEVISLIDVTRNLKHKTMLAVAYSAGLRREELVNLRVVDIDSKRMVIRVCQGKGKKDRETLLSEKALTLLRQYYQAYKPKDLLFEGFFEGKPISFSSFANILKKAMKKAGIHKNASIHSLRHSFATHLLEQGTNLKTIQRLLGHHALRTTSLYLHLATVDPKTVRSPLDTIDS